MPIARRVPAPAVFIESGSLRFTGVRLLIIRVAPNQPVNCSGEKTLRGFPRIIQERQSHARRSRSAPRIDQAIPGIAEEASLTSMSQPAALPN
jgi:hypothetical protein